MKMHERGRKKCRKEKVEKKNRNKGKGSAERRNMEKYGLKLSSFQQGQGNKTKLLNLLWRRLPPFHQQVDQRFPYLFRDKSLSVLNTRPQMSFDSSVHVVHANHTDTAHNLF